MCKEKDAYKKYIQDYSDAEKKRNAKGTRTNWGCLSKDWGSHDLSGKSVLVIGENGIGDEVLTISCLPDLVKTCESVSWKCDPKLKLLFSRSFPDVSFVTDDDPQPVTDGTIYSWQLIGQFRKDLSDFPQNNGHNAAYLKPLPSLVSDLSTKFHDGQRKTIGLAWRSERNGELLSDKSCGLLDVPHWAAFFKKLRGKARFVSLQYGDTSDEIAYARWKYGVEIYQDTSIDFFNDVDSAAAIVAAMDYVASISTTTAHLAGALGRPGWVLLKKCPFPFWRAGKDKCPWYPTLRPVRQKTAGDWLPVLEKAADDVSEAITSPHSGKTT